MLLWFIFFVLVSLLVTLVVAEAQTPTTEPPGATVISDAAGAPVGVRVPGYLSCSYPDQGTLEISPQSGVEGWKDSATTVVWYGDIKTTGGYVAPKTPLMYGDKLTRKAVGAPPSAEAQAIASRELTPK